MARHDTLCSSVRFIDSSIAARLAATALRMAGPMIGKIASGGGFGSRRAGAAIAFLRECGAEDGEDRGGERLRSAADGRRDRFLDRWRERPGQLGIGRTVDERLR